MLNCCWSRASQGFSWTVCILLLSSSSVLSESLVPSNNTEADSGSPVFGSVRLVNGTRYAGRVEIFYDGAWGTICGGVNGWQANEVKVLCKSLGFGNGEVIPVNHGSGNIFLAKVKCQGTEASIVNCDHNNFQENDCQHESDVGVNCEDIADVITISSVGDCNFEYGFCGYTIQGNSSFKWKRDSGTTPSGSTGPSADHTYSTSSGYYMYTEASYGYYGTRTRLVSQISNYFPASISFWYHMYGYDMGSLNVKTVENNYEKKVWSKTGEKGNYWKYACIPIKSAFEQLVFEGIRGNGYLGDMAIDDVVFSQNTCTSINKLDCTFENGLCEYEVVKGKGSSVIWTLIAGSTYRAPIYDHTTNKASGKYLSMYNYYNEGMRSYLISPPIVVSHNVQLEFYYYMGGSQTGELYVSYKDKSAPLNSWNKNDWHDSGDHGTKWNFGCMDLYPEQKQDKATEKRIVFTGNTGTSYGIYLALDDIKVSNGSCEMGIGAHVCTFDNPKLCHYTINCTALLEYTWRRMRRSTSSYKTGPSRDASKDYKGYYLYAEGSYGKAGDAVSIKFPVKNTAGKYLKFNYHMYGQSMGSLHLFYTSGQSSREVWQMSGNQGNVWKSFCRQIGEEIDEVKLVAVRGSKYTSDIALDNVFLTSEPCPNSVDCTFESGMCNYTVTNDYYRYKWARVSGTDHTYGSGYFMRAYHYSSTEGYMTNLTTPIIQQTSNMSSLQFYYSQYRADTSKIMVEINRLSGKPAARPKHFHLNQVGWIMGCIDLPANEQISANFIAVSGGYTAYSIMLDDVSYNESSCVVGIVNNICIFDEPNVCGYNVSCREASKFLWKRAQSTSSSSTGPSSDHTRRGRKYFMYTESSFGDPGDTTELLFPEFVTPPGHYLSFYYNMYGRDIGTLQVHIITRSGKMLKWSETGDMGQNWEKGCVNLPVNEKTTVVFTGIRGNGPLGDMAIDDVGVVSGVCDDQSIPCDFNDEAVCGYRNMSHPSNSGWVRKRSGSGYYMNAVGSYEKISLKSVLGNISDSCIQISYRIKGKYCGLNVYTSYNKEKYLSLKENNNTDWQKAQFYIQNAETSLIFEADIKVYWMYCILNIDKIAILNGKCPDLDCMNTTQACTDQGHCIDKSSICDKEADCYDGSDESNCSRSVTCDFEDKYTCGYNYPYGWSHQKLSTYHLPELMLNNSEYSMVLEYGTGSLSSPFEMISQSCVQFHHIGDIGSHLLVNVHNSNGTNSTSWSYFYSHGKWTLGQFEIPGGNISLTFSGFRRRLGIAIDNVNLQDGYCGPIVCPDDYFTCGSNEKCISPRSKCDRIQDCADNSDEVNCVFSAVCDVENPYQCGYEYEPGTWRVSSGRNETYPDLDHSRGLYSGHFFVSSFSRQSNDTVHDLHVPEVTLPVDACFSFYYSFHGSGELEIFDNGVPMLKIRPNSINTWQKSQIQLSPGKHNITFCHINGNYSNLPSYHILALDSIDLSNGTCGLLDCEKGWRKCSNSPVCVPEFKFCDHEEDCANGEDERNCSTYSNMRLVRGRNVQQGDVEIFYNGRWNLICGSWTRQNAAVACRELGYTSSRRTYRSKVVFYAKSYIQSIKCNGYESSLKNCRKHYCFSTCNCYVYAAVDCSNTLCESSQVPCVASNATNSNNSISNLQCIAKESVCDGEKDCPGGTDEQSCTKCKSDEFQCLNYECIPQDKHCDGINNCKDGSDEYYCFKHDNLTLLFMMNGKYTPVCENNLKDQDIANKLCHYVGKGNASVVISNIKTTGVKFSYSKDSQHSVLPGFKPSLADCNALRLNCSRRECGTRSATLYDPVIAYGQKAIPGKWPWQAAVMNRGTFSCGGVLLNDRYVLSAAQCFRGSSSPGDYEIGLGSTVLSSLQKMKVRKIKVHQNYSYAFDRNDVALLELMTPVQTTDYIRPACLPAKPWELYMLCYTTGWGQNETNDSQKDLMETKVKILQRDVCYKEFSNMDTTLICANHNQPTPPARPGDEGGPLVCRNMQGYWSVYGVVSWTLYSQNTLSRQLYADVFTLRKWITDHMMN